LVIIYKIILSLDYKDALIRSLKKELEKYGKKESAQHKRGLTVFKYKRKNGLFAYIGKGAAGYQGNRQMAFPQTSCGKMAGE